MGAKYTTKTDSRNRINSMSVRLFPQELKQALIEASILRGITLKQVWVEACCLWLLKQGVKVPKFYQSGLLSKKYTGHETRGKIKKGKRL